MRGEQHLLNLERWIFSPAFPALERAYADNYKKGTLGTRQKEPHCAHENDYGVIRPEKFLWYLTELQFAVAAAKRDEEIDSNILERSLPILCNTLTQMHASPHLPTGKFEDTGLTLAEIFQQGRDAGDELRAYLDGLSRSHHRPSQWKNEL